MKNIKLIFSLLALFPLLVSAQTNTYFNNRYRFDRPNGVFTSVLCDKERYIASGITTDTTINHYVQNVFSFISDEGIIDSIKFFGFTGNDYGTWTNSLLKTSDNGFAQIGYISDNVGTTGLFLKYDSSGSVLFHRTFKDYIDTGIVTLLPQVLYETPDKGFLICGDYQKPIYGDVRLFILKVDSLGNPQWKKIHNTSTLWEAMQYGANIIKTHKNTYMLGCYKTDLNLPPSYTWLLEVDSLGNKIREYIDPDPHTTNANGLRETSDHGYIYGGYYRIDTFVNTHYNRGHIVKMDSNFNKKWELIIGRSYDNTGFNDLELLPNGDIIAAGQNLESFPNVQPDWEAIAGWVVKVSSSGNVIWERRYCALDSNHLPTPTWCYSHDVDIDNKGNILVCGESFSVFQGNYPQRAWLLKLDPYGCLVPGCQNVGIASPTETKQVLSLYPNPTADMLYIYFHDAAAQSGDYAFIIRDLQGKEIVPKTALSNSTTYLFATHALAQGMYVLELWKKGAFVEVQKFVKE
jgi:hypothetical protein